MRINYFLFLVLFLLISCKQKDTAPGDDKIDLKLEDVGVEIANHYNYNEPDSLIALFDHRQFSKRLGQPFFNLDKRAQSYVIGMVMQYYDETNRFVLSEMQQRGLFLELLAVNQDEQVSKLFYRLINQSGERLFTYLVLYVQQDASGDYKIVNQYDVSKAYSLGQNSKITIRNMQKNRSFQKGAEKAFAILSQAVALEKTHGYEAAYKIMEDIKQPFTRIPAIANYRFILASHLGAQPFIQEAKYLKSITPNEQSKMFYDCIIMEQQDPSNKEAVTSCYESFIERLVQ
ncbi:hypothetical protein [Nonlabens ponticola]|uniref:Uncharacterized protein n=1 Tax=Nonlabens ponticola TaxID=2496866 RepID=A0A3S9MY18_9FLAO|nr:hypothetical protein [Nonlabens ponticola]AZQ44037.1 hypothetical protein EJ995_07250 [Nonlabens ponticola]